MRMSFSTPPPKSSYAVLDFPEPHVVMLSLTALPMNQANTAARNETDRAVKWFDSEKELWVMIVTGSKNSRAFCVGADLKEWLELNKKGQTISESSMLEGFCGISRRKGLKPIIAAVNGYAFGIAEDSKCDLVIASTKASFALPEVKRGVFARAGALGRIIRFIGLQRASELALIGDPISPQKMYEWGIVNAIVPPEELIPTAIKWARKICANSPDAVIVSRTGMLMSLENGSLERGTQLHNASREVCELETGVNISEGLAAFNEKRSPRWRSSKI